MDRLEDLIKYAKKPNVSEWVYEVEAFLNETDNNSDEARELIKGIKLQGDAFIRCENLIALLKQIQKKTKIITIPHITKRKQIFVAMMFSEKTNIVYEQAYKPIISEINYSAMRIDEKEFSGLIIEEILSEISDSNAIIADLTGNRGGVYYEAGVAKGLQLCNHPIKLILTCQKAFFDDEGVHFDLKGDNILLYEDCDDLKMKLKKRLSAVLLGGQDYEQN